MKRVVCGADGPSRQALFVVLKMIEKAAGVMKKNHEIAHLEHNQASRWMAMNAVNCGSSLMRAVWVIYPITTRQMNSLNTSATTAQAGRLQRGPGSRGSCDEWRLARRRAGANQTLRIAHGPGFLDGSSSESAGRFSAQLPAGHHHRHTRSRKARGLQRGRHLRCGQKNNSLSANVS